MKKVVVKFMYVYSNEDDDRSFTIHRNCALTRLTIEKDKIILAQMYSDRHIGYDQSTTRKLRKKQTHRNTYNITITNTKTTNRKVGSKGRWKKGKRKSMK